MPPAGSCRSLFTSESIDAGLVNPSLELLSEDEQLSEKNNLMDLDEFLSIHESRIAGEKQSDSADQTRPARDLLSNLLQRVHKNMRLEEQTNDNEDLSSAESFEYGYAKEGYHRAVETDDPAVNPFEDICREKHSKRRKPRTYKYNPKPVQQKNCRSFVPDLMKDEDYWERRKKNNLAAKKSREDRRRKELEVLQKMARLENTNSELLFRVKELEEKNAQLQKTLILSKKL